MKTTARTLQYLRSIGVEADLVERRTPVGTRDYFGIIDIIAVTPESTIGIQACGSDLMEHVRKIMDDCPVATTNWLNGPRELQIYAWRKVKMSPKTTRQVWRARVVRIVLTKEMKLMWYEMGDD